MTFKIKTPSETFNGDRGGVTFKNGVAVIEDKELVRVFQELGYTVEKMAAKKATTTKKRGE